MPRSSRLLQRGSQPLKTPYCAQVQHAQRLQEIVHKPSEMPVTYPEVTGRFLSHDIYLTLGTVSSVAGSTAGSPAVLSGGSLGGSKRRSSTL